MPALAWVQDLTACTLVAVLNYLAEVAWVDHQRIAMGKGSASPAMWRPACALRPSRSKLSATRGCASVPASARCSRNRRCSPAARA